MSRPLSVSARSVCLETLTLRPRWPASSLTVTLPLGDSAITQSQLDELYQSFYANDAFVSVLVGGKQPKTSSVAGTNRAHVAAIYNAHANVIVATGAIDNVGKGAAGQAVQCANIICGLPETTGLVSIAIPA